ncbi:DNA methyltransferase [Anaerococcus urinomassiliensis]|uniref:DNA methyltransferase n=1 Tax=Anaerococcus urinomassiliensis TaxID=1745712 RepID=UPI00093B0952|nr:DNA methyltransferase [Anaerococcus urinomassiliensis]
MNQREQKQKANEFVNRWQGKGNEKAESQRFWLDLLQNVYGIDQATAYVRFEDKVMLDNASFIDIIIPDTHVLIEQKSRNKSLDKAIKQSDGALLSPFQQAKRYSAELPYSQRPRWIVTCNFKQFYIYDMEKPTGEPEKILLEDLPEEAYRMNFLVDKKDENIIKEMEVSLQAGEIVGFLYDALLNEYNNPQDPQTLKDLNILCVRLVFCFYAEDAGLFGHHNMFHDYLGKFDESNFRSALIDLFNILNQPEEKRDPYLDPELLAFPYVNGGLFAEANIEIPRLNPFIRDIILEKASRGFDWSKISPTIFGSVFESTLNPETRRAGGMHYTSIENIHKVIDPLFLNDLRDEFDQIKSIKTEKIRNNKLEVFQNKLASIKFLDPAAGSGNFLTETYLSLRKLENEAIKTRFGDQIFMGDVEDPIKVSLDQFYGIEINDFAVTVAKTALWISEDQMMKETEEIIHANIDFLPLKSYANIVEGNALRMDWEEVVAKDDLDYIMGNPPFVGKKEQSKDQKADLREIFGKLKGLNKLDYVSGWYKKASNYIQDTKIHTAFVSTNSITQGEQVSILWKNLILENGISINFAYRTFKWDSEASLKAHVHVVIVGFSIEKLDKNYLYSQDTVKIVNDINAYLVEAPNTFIDSRKKPIDNGNLILNKEELKNILKENIKNKEFIKKYIGGYELLNNKMRWCIWLTDKDPSEYRKSSRRKETLKLADTPYLFGEIRQPNSDMLVIPKVSSERRKYLPLKFVDKDTIVNGSALILATNEKYIFGILTSNVHMSWMRAVAGRMKSDYQYSASIVYNNFPWPDPSPEQKQKIEKTAQGILDARELYPASSLADLYDELTMPVELRRAHQENDKAVMEAYGFDWRTMTESECVAELMKIYQDLVK